MISMTDLIIICVKTLMIYSECSLENKFTKLIRMNILIILFLTINHVNLCHSCVYGPLT